MYGISFSAYGAITSPGVIAGNQTGVSGYKPATITSTSAATVSSGSPSPGYGWDLSIDGLTWTNITGATSATYAPPLGITQTTYYRRKARNTTSGSWEAYSNVVVKAVCGLSLSLTPTNPTCGSSNGSIVAVGTNGLGGTGSATIQGWFEIPGGDVSNLTSNGAYPNNPSYSSTVNFVESPSNVLDRFGGRINGYIIPDKTGVHYFWISSDDSGEFWLSTDSNPANKIKRAFNTSYTSIKEWNNANNTNQKSAGISLTAGQIYYFETLYKENGGDDHLAVGWSKPGESTATPSELIPGTDLRPYSVASGTDPVYQYKIGSGAYQNSGIFPNLAAGSYTITVKDSYGCTTELQQTLTSPAAISTTITSNSPVCSGSTLNLSAGAVTGGGTETPNYSWSGPNGIVPNSQGASVTFSNVTPNNTGIYTLTVNRGACSGTFTTSVNIVALPSATITSTNPTCGSNDGTITFTFPSNLSNGLSISLNGGTSYAYSVTAGSRSYMITGQAAGTKNIKMKWANQPSCESVTTNLVMTAGTSLPAVTITSPDSVLCASSLGTSYTLNSNASGTGPYSMQWQELNGDTWSNISLATGTSYTRLLAPEGAKTYRLQTNLAACTTTYSNEFTVKVLSQATSKVIAPLSVICINQLMTFGSEIRDGAGTPAYQWQKSSSDTPLDWENISGATASTYSPSTSSAGKLYYRVIVTMSGKNCNTAISPSVPLTVENPGATTVTPATTTICKNGTLLLTSSGTLNRVWQKFSQNEQNWIDLPVTTATYSPINSEVGTFRYRVKVTSPTCGFFYSSEAVITVVNTPATSATIDKPVICVGGSATISGGVTGNTGTSSYQWQQLSGGSWTNINGATSINYSTLTSLAAGTYSYKLIVNNTVNGCGPVESAPVLLTIVADPVISVTASGDLICMNSVNTLSAVVRGGVPGSFNYKWKSASTSGGSLSEAPGVNDGATYTLPTNTVGTLYYTVEVAQKNDIYGCTTPVTSTPPKTVKVEPLPIVSASSTTNTGLAGSSTIQCVGTVFSLYAVSANSPTAVTGYTWTGQAGFSSNVQNPQQLSTSINQQGSYQVTATGLNGCTNTATTSLTLDANCDTRCSAIVDVRPVNPSSCTGDNGSIVIDEFGSTNYESSLDGKTWIRNGSIPITYGSKKPGTYLVYLREYNATAPRTICRSVYIRLEAKTTFGTLPVASNAQSCKSATGSITLPVEVADTDSISWLSARKQVFVLVSSLSKNGNNRRIIQNLLPGTYYVRVTRGGEYCYKETMITVGNTANDCISNQVCTTPNLVNLFPNGDFGSGVDKHGPVLSNYETQYGYSKYGCSSPNDGFYTIVNNTDCDGAGGKTFGGAGGAGGWDVLGQDHTPGDTGGYMMVVNASHNPDIVIEKSISALCPKTQYNFTAWIYNLIPNEDIKPNLSFLIDGVVYYVTGNITTNGWKQVGFSFTTGNITSSVFSIRNNAPGGDGNDWVIDDIVVSKCPMNITMNANVVACVGTASKTITATVADPYQEYVYYKWQESSNNGASWTDISTVASGTYSGGNMTVSTIITGPFTYAHSGKKYRIKLATTASSIDDATCSVASAEATLTVPQITSTITAPIEKCAGTGSTTLTASGGGGTAPYTYSWSDALGSTASVTVNPAATKSYTVTVTDANGCSTTATTQITIKPLPVASATGTTICSGETFSVTPTTSIAGTKYTWTISIISGSVTGQQAQTAAVDGPFAQVLTNTGTVNAVVRYTVTPVANGCSGTPFPFDVTVRPVPAVNNISNQAVCSGLSTTAVTFGGTGTSYSWTNNNTTIGLASGGTGNINAFTGVNAGNAPITATITVTPIANGCSGPSKTFTITVNPIPTLDQPDNQVLCAGGTTNAVNFTGSISGTTFSWTNNTTSIGLAASGTGNINAFTATNAGTTPVTATIIVTPSSNGCAVAPKTFTITVSPKPVVNLNLPSASVCINVPVILTATINGGTSGLTRKWQSSANGSSGWTDVSGQTGLSLIVPTGTPGGTYYRMLVNDPAAGCGEVASAASKVTVFPQPTVTTPGNKVLCTASSSGTISFNGTVSGTTYSWTNNNIATGLATSGTGNIASFTATNTTSAAITSTITVTPTANGCAGDPVTFTITVSPKPTVAKPANQTLCVGAVSTAITFAGAVTGTTYTWTNKNTATGLAASGTGSIGSFTATNTTSAAITSTITVTPTANGCAGDPVTFTITVSPKPTVIKPADQALCVGATSTAITFAGAVTGTTYSWTNNDIATGLATSGTGNIASFTATNTTSAAITSTITVTPTANGCAGDPVTFTITVNPKPTVIKPADQTLCVGATSTAITFAGAVTGTTYSWTNNDIATGLATSGTGSIASFTATNATSAAITSTITVTPTANGCAGDPVTFTITVSPKPTVIKPADQTLCVGATSTAITFAGAVTGTTYSWTNNNTATGLATSGTGSIASFTATNATSAAITSTITVTPTANGCAGDPVTFTITVNPTPSVVKPSNQALCASGSVSPAVFSGPVSGTTYTWINNNPSIGLAGSGTGNIGSFTAINNGTTPVTATITVTPKANDCPGTSQTFTITVYPKPTVSVSIPSETVCVGTPLTLTASVSGGSGNTSQKWQISSDGNTWTDIVGQTGMTYTVPTNASSEKYYQIVITDNGSGCGSITSVPSKITVISTVTIGITPNNNQVCIGETLTLTASINNAAQGLTYQWYSSPNQSDTTRLTGQTGLTLTVPTNIKGIMYYRLQVTSPVTGCGTVKSGFTSVEVRPLPAVTFTKTDALCETGNGKIVFSFQDEPGQTTLEFSLDGGLTYPYSVNDNSGSFTVNALSSSTYQLYARWGGGACPVNLGTTTISDRPAPLATSLKTDPTCTISNGTIRFNFQDVAGRTGYKFSLDGGLTYLATVADNSGSVTYSGLAPGTYDLWVKWDNNECPVNLPDLTLTDQRGPVVNLGQDLEICNGVAVNITAATTGGTPALIYSWNNGLNGVPSHQVSPTITTTYIVTVKDANNCTSKDTLQIIVNANPVLTIANAEVCENQNIRLTSSGGGTYAWTGPNSFVSALQNPEIVNANAGLHAGVYSLTITNGFGCHTSGTMTVIVNALPAPPTLTGAEKCGPESLTLNATGCSGTISWFDKIFYGNNVGIGTTFATPTLSETTAYFALCSSTKNCDSPVRSSVLAKINNQPVAEIIPVDPTCLGVQSANNGRIIITRYRDNEKYSFNIGTTYNSGLANVPALIPSNGTISTTIPNPSNNASENYTIRIISNEGCTIDRVIKIDNKCIDCPVDYCPPSTITKIE